MKTSKTKSKAVEVPAPSEQDLKLQRQNKEKHLSNLQKEIKVAKETTQDLKDRYELLKEEMAVTKDNHPIVMSNLVLLNKTWKFESDPKYMENTRKLNEINFKKKMMDFNVQKTRMESALESATAAIKSLQEEIDRIQGELK